MTAPKLLPEPTLLLLADISGYTRYIRENPYTEAHAITNITALLDAVLDCLAPYWRLAKLEGDAAFCHAPALGREADFAGRLITAFTAFAEGKARLIAVNGCHCLACKALPSLELKMILHAGPVLHFTTRSGAELGGLPVIVLHRLAKNRLPASRYILWTAPLDSSLAALQPAFPHHETVEGIGGVATWVHDSLPGLPAVVPAARWRRLLDLGYKAWLWLPATLQGKHGKAAAYAEPVTV